MKRTVHQVLIGTDPGDVDAIIADLAALMRRHRRALARNWCLDGVSTTHLHVLMALDADGPQPMGRLAETLLCSLPNATGIVDRMVERGLVERVRDDEDRRLVLVRLSTAGRQTLDELEMVRHHQVRRILDAMDPRERRCCADAFRAMRETADRLDADGALVADGSLVASPAADGPPPVADRPH